MGKPTAVDVKRTALAAALAAMTLGSLLTAGRAVADPLNPNHPDYCGNSPDVFFCTYHRSTYPNAGESAFLDATRGRVPGIDARHLAAGRAICLELASDNTGHVVGDTAKYLAISQQAAGQVVDDANRTICPEIER